MLTECPECGSCRLSSPIIKTGHVGCMECLTIFEDIPDGETWLTDGELMPWREPCENCAFRPGSPESADKKAWRELLGKLRRGGAFYCHKGVPVNWDRKTLEDPTASGVHDFKYPKGADGKEDPEQMRACRGFLNVWSKWMEQEFGKYVDPALEMRKSKQLRRDLDD